MSCLSPYSGRPIRGNRSRAFPRSLVFLDTETRIHPGGQYNQHRFLLGWMRFIHLDSSGCISSDRWESFQDSAALCQSLHAAALRPPTLHLFGHNLFYDLASCGFFPYFAREGWSLRFIYDEGLSFILSISRGSAHLKAVSSTNYFDYSLAQLGDDILLPKITLDPLKASLEELLPYCRRDVEILSEGVLSYMRFNREHDTGSFRLTRASQAMAAYRHRFMPREIFPHAVSTVRALERSAYFGGRVEAFRLGNQGKGPFHFYDINSMYPAVMRENRFPCKLIDYLIRPDPQSLYDRSASCAIIARVGLETRDPAYAYRGKTKILFPVGAFNTTVCTAGFRRAFERGEIRSVAEASIYECDFLFRSYVDYFYPLKSRYKAQGNRTYTAIVKLFLNSLYGKFGQQQPVEEWFDLPDQIEPYRVDEIDMDTGARQTRFGMFGKVVIQYAKEDSPESFTGIAAHVTEYGRLALWNSITAVGPGRVLYCDTDSMVLHGRDAHRMRGFLDPGRLGAFSLDSTCQSLVLYAPKDYSVDGGRKTKGVPKSAECIGLHTYRYESFCRLATHLREGLSDHFLSRPTVKMVNPCYDKGTPLPDGSVAPYLLVEPPC